MDGLVLFQQVLRKQLIYNNSMRLKVEFAKAAMVFVTSQAPKPLGLHNGRIRNPAL